MSIYAGRRVREQDRIDRSSAQSSLRQTLDNDLMVALCAPFRTGKTTVALSLESQLNGEVPGSAVVIDSRELDDFSVRRILAIALNRLGLNGNLLLATDSDVSTTLVITISQICSTLDRRVYIILDEADLAITSSTDENWLVHMQHVVTSQTMISLLLLTPSPAEIYRRPTVSWHMTVVDLQIAPASELRRLSKSLSQIGCDGDPRYTTFIERHSAPHPYLMECLATAFINTKDGSNTISTERALVDYFPRAVQFFEDMVRFVSECSQHRGLSPIELLLRIAGTEVYTSHRTKIIESSQGEVESVKPKTISEKAAVAFLKRIGAVQMNEARELVTFSPLFAHWIVENYNASQNRETVNSKTLALRFKEVSGIETVKDALDAGRSAYTVIIGAGQLLAWAALLL